MVEDEQFNSLINLFKSLNLAEKGAVEFYHFFLNHKKCDNIKILEKELKLTQKRIYKIAALLKENNLIQVYNRPMKIQLLDPVRSLEKLVQKQIDEIHLEAEKKIENCYRSLERLKEQYHLTENEQEQQPVEFISLLGIPDVESVLYPLLCDKKTSIAHGIWYHYNFIKYLLQNAKDKENLEVLKNTFNRLSSKNIRVLVSADYINHALNVFNKNDDLQKLFKLVDIDNMNFNIRVIEEEFSNFVVKDDIYLVQPSFDPSDNLIGFFVSGNQEIIKVFNEKFETFFNKAKPIDSKYEKDFHFMLCL